MAQSPNAMQEPSMDELLASIREIIEENTGPSPNRNANRQDTSSTEAANSAQNSTAVVNPTGGNTNVAAVSNAHHNAPHNAKPHNEQQFNQPSEHNSNASMETPPVRDAMNALAARIGLRHNERPELLAQNTAPHQDSNLIPPAPAAMIMKKVPVERNLQAPSDGVVSAQPRQTAQNSHNPGNINTNSGNFNSGPSNQGNAQNIGARQMNIGGARPLNTSEHPIHPRNEARPNPITNQAAQQQSAVQPRQIEPAKVRDVAPQRDMALLREGQSDGIVRHQPMQPAGAMPAHDGRHLPPQPRVGNAAARPNQPHPAPSQATQENLNDGRVYSENQRENRGENRNENQAQAATHNVQADNSFEAKREAKAIQQPLENQLAETKFSREGMHNSNTRNVGEIPENRINHDAPAPRQQATPTVNNNSSNNLPHPRSAPQKPHFLSQALRSAFLSIPAKDSAFQTASSLPQTPLRPQNVSAAGAQQPTRVELKAAEMIEAEVKREMDNLDKALDADFEKSAENLLRPYIAKWLDDHFSDLFEKVLREEIKRVIQAQLR